MSFSMILMRRIWRKRVTNQEKEILLFLHGYSKVHSPSPRNEGNFLRFKFEDGTSIKLLTSEFSQFVLQNDIDDELWMSPNRDFLHTFERAWSEIVEC